MHRSVSQLRSVRQLLQTRAVDLAVRRAGPAVGRRLLELDYPPNQRNVPRYSEPHSLLDEIITRNRTRYAETIATIQAYADDLAKIQLVASQETEPAWINNFLPGLDSAAIYGLLRAREPSRYLEIGSGHSTRFAARAKADGHLHTTITSIDPFPRASINSVCDEIIRRPLESVSPTVWQTIKSGDMVFMDGSHRVFMNGDVVAFFLDVLPCLPPDVLVGIHDIFLPYDYPTEMSGRYYSEQYLLAVWLLGKPDIEIVLPAYYASIRMDSEVKALWSMSEQLALVQPNGGAFWFETR